MSVRKSEASTLDAASRFDSLPDSFHVRLPVVMLLFACSSATVWRRVKNKTFPSPKRIGARTRAWQVGELRQFLREIESTQ